LMLSILVFSLFLALPLSIIIMSVVVVALCADPSVVIRE
jgi:hypothetical protein